MGAAAAQVWLKRVAYRVIVRPGPAPQQTRDRDHQSGRAVSALLESAANLDAREPEPVAKDERQGFVRTRLEAVRHAVDVEADRVRHA